MFTQLLSALKEPLLHFLALGLCLFLVYNTLNPDADSDNPTRIQVDQEALLTYMQYREKAFDEERFQQRLDTMPVEERQQLINDYVREETLYREAKALELDKNDTVARQRLIQQMRYLTQGIINAGITITEEDLQRFLSAHIDRYIEPATVTFTHVFFSTANRSENEALRLSQQALARLKDEKVPFHKAIGHGERFLYHRNYVGKDGEFIASHFGESMQKAVFSLPASDVYWQGPYQSEHGYHLVLVSQHTPPHTPELSEVKPRVAQDLKQQRRQEQVEKAIGLIVERYDVEVSADLSTNKRQEES